MACLRLVTVPPFPPLPDFNVPRFSLCIARFTLSLAALPYFREDPFRVGIRSLRSARAGAQQTNSTAVMSKILSGESRKKRSACPYVVTHAAGHLPTREAS